MAFSSGMSAFVCLMETLRSGDRVAAPRVMYHGSLAWLRRIAERRGIGLDLYDGDADGALEAAVVPGATRIVWVETPSNPTWTVTDIAAAATVAHEAGARLAVDCTAAPPCTLQALALGADLAFHSATKYMGGHSDLTAGVLAAAATGPFWDDLRKVRSLTGTVLAPFEAWLLIRGLRTLFLRYERASENALAIARHFDGHPAVTRVLYPGLESHPRHASPAPR
jgi:cystathionine gamma-synthase